MCMLEDYIRKLKRTGDIAEDVHRYLTSFGYQKTAKHCAAVAAEAQILALRYDCDPTKAELAGYLHDISAVIPNDKKVDFAQDQMVDVLAEEVACPMILHQKLSVVIARAVFEITDMEVLSAIGCHTTLKANAGLLDKIVFIADKIAWDQDGQPPYIRKVSKAMDQSLDAGVLVYLNFLWERRSQLQIIHPWFVDARDGYLNLS